MLLLLLSIAWCNPLDAWGPHVGHRVLALNPNVYRAGDGATELQGITSLGVTRRLDLNVAAATVRGADGRWSPGPVEVLPRVFVFDGVGLVLHGLWQPEGWRIGPEMHLTRHLTGPLALYSDGGVALGAEGLEQAVLVAGLEWAATDRIGPYLESSTEWSLQGDPVVVYGTPGVYLALDGDGGHELSMGVRVPLAGASEPVVGAWYNANLRL